MMKVVSIVMRLRILLQSMIGKVFLRIYGVRIGESTRIKGNIYVDSPRCRIIIGERCTINSNRYSVPIGFEGRCSFWCIGDGRITIGNNVQMTNVSIASKENVSIDDEVMIGAGVKIYDTDFHSLNRDIRMSANDNDRKSKKIRLREGCFVGAGSMILKGADIGMNSIIAAGSIVTGEIPDNQIWGGTGTLYPKYLTSLLAPRSNFAKKAW